MRRFRAPRLVVPVLLLVFGLHLLVSLNSPAGRAGVSALLGGILLLLLGPLFFAFLLTILLNRTGSSSGWPLSMIIAMMRGSARLIARTLSAGLRASAGAATAGAGPLADHLLPIRRFRVRTTPTGTEVACVMRGELEGDEVRQGDRVRVHGVRERHQVLRVRRVEILGGPGGVITSEVRPRPAADYRLARGLDLASKAVLALLAIDILLLLT